MANKDQPQGLRPYERLIRARRYTAGSAIYPGDPVAMAADGQIDASVTAPLLGVALSYASAAGQEVLVADDPDQMFVVQSDAALAATDVGINAPLTLGTPSTTYKRSGCELDGANAAADAALDVKILGISPEPGNEAGAVNVDVIVKINSHFLGNIVAGVA